MESRGRRVHSIEKAIRLLDCFWETDSPLSLHELEQRTGWAKSTIHGLLATMLDSAVVEQNPTDGKYRLGYPPLVTPMSQMVGVQATANVLAGERYKNISKEVKNYIKGEYGKAPGKINEELQKKVLGDEEPITCRYANLLEPGLPAAIEYLGDRATCDEDVLSYIAFPTQAEAFFDKRDERKKNTFTYKIERLD